MNALRAQMRNDEALVEHYNARLQGADFEPSIPVRLRLLVHRAHVVARMNKRRDELTTFSPTAEPSAPKSDKPADSSHELQPSRPAVGENLSHV